MIKKLLLNFMCCWLFSVGHAQTPKMDSLNVVLQSIPDDSKDNVQMRRCADILIDLCLEINSQPKLNHTDYRSIARRLLALSAQLDYPQGKRTALRCIGNFYIKQNRYPEAIDTFLLCYKLEETMRDTPALTKLASLISTSFLELGNAYDQAALYARNCMDLAKRANRQHGVCACQSLLSSIYANSDQLDSAEYHATVALALAQQIGSTHAIPNLYFSLASIETKRKNFSAERGWLLRLEKDCQENKKNCEDSFLVDFLLGLFLNALNRDDLADARAYQKKLKPFSAKIALDLRYRLRYYACLSELAELERRPNEALKYYKMHIEARDSINDLEKTRRTTQIQMNYDFERKQAIRTAVQEQELALRDARNRQQRLIFGFVTLALIAGAGFWFYAYRQTQNRQRTELELASLRAQINPHFIFNCLNSIYRYTKERDTDTASKYLQKFSSLLRLVLENSRTERITLARDLEALQLYTDIEGLRFKEKLRFSVDMDPDIDPTFIEIPGMVIQPYVENAIWHGLMHRPTGGEIVVRFHQPSETLLRVEIEDNGIGRAAAGEYGSKTATVSKSLGQKITAERLKATGKLANTETIDLFDEVGHPAGTRIVLDIPL